jgi:hypothetical protein
VRSDLISLGLSMQRLQGRGDHGKTFPESDTKDLARGARFIPALVTLERRRGGRVTFHQACGSECCWYWQFRDGTRIYHFDLSTFLAIARANGRTIVRNDHGMEHPVHGAGPCPLCGNEHTHGGTEERKAS